MELQRGQGWLRHGKPLYLGSGDFDKFVRKCTFGKDWIYIVSLVSSLILGIWLYLL